MNLEYSTNPEIVTLRPCLRPGRNDLEGVSVPEGFGTEPEELLRAATAITDTLDQVAGLEWQGPSGAYGHDGVHTGWGQFVDEAKAEIDKLTEAAEGHGESLRDAAHHYQESDSQVVELLNKIVSDAFDPTAGTAGGAFTGTDASGTARTSGPAGGDFAGATASGTAPTNAPAGADFAGESGSGSANTGWSGDLGEVLGQRRSGELFPGMSESDIGKAAEH